MPRHRGTVAPRAGGRAGRVCAAQVGECNGDPSTACGLVDIPQVVMARVVRGLSVEDLVPCALAVHEAVDWAPVVEERWPLHGAPAGGIASQRPWSKPIVLLASLVEASRLAAQLLHWPSPTITQSASPGTSPLMHPATPEVKAGLTGPVLGTTAPTAAASVLQWLPRLAHPVSINFEAAVHSLSLQSLMIIAQTCVGELRGIRRSDLKQIMSVKVRDASCFDVTGEHLIIGTLAPARLIAYDMSASVPRVRHQVRLKAAQEGSCSVVAASFRDADTCICCLAREDAACFLEVVIVDASAELKVTSRLDAVGFAMCRLGCVTAGADGCLSLWDLAPRAFEKRVDWPRGPFGDMADVGPVRVAEVSGRFVAASAPHHARTPIWVHDLQHSGEPVFVSHLANASLGLVEGSGEGIGAGAAGLRWTVELMHVEGSLLVVVAQAFGSDWSLDGNTAEGVELLPPCGPRLFAWHLPTCRPLLAGHATPLITTFARSQGGEGGGRLAFAGGRHHARGGRTSYFVVLPGMQSFRRTPRRSIDGGPPRRKVSGSDLRARGYRKR